MSTIPNFSLRPAKYVQRRMIVDSLGFLEPLAPLSSYRYVGMGSRSFGDFRLFHKQFRIRKMISMESDDVEFQRATFNRPYACIDLRHEHSSDTLTSLDWDVLTIAWLDTMGRVAGWVLDDVQLITSNAPSGSVLIVTVNVAPYQAPPNDPDGTERVVALAADLGESREVPYTIERNSQLNRERFPDVSYGFIAEEIADTVSARTGLTYRQLYHFRYADGAPMLTVGGVLIDESQAEALDWDALFVAFPYLRDHEEPYEIIVPELTLREMRHIDQLLPCDPTTLTDPQVEPIPLDQAQKYAEAYRYFPAYVDADVV